MHRGEQRGLEGCIHYYHHPNLSISPPEISGCASRITPISQLWRAPHHCPDFPLPPHSATFVCLCGEARYNLSFLHFSVLSHKVWLFKAFHLSCVIFPSLISFTLSLSPAPSSSVPFYSRTLFLPVPGNRVRESVTLWLPLIVRYQTGWLCGLPGKADNDMIEAWYFKQNWVSIAWIV